MTNLIEIQKLIYKTYRIKFKLKDNILTLAKYNITIEDTTKNFIIKVNNLHIYCNSTNDIIIILKKFII